MSQRVGIMDGLIAKRTRGWRGKRYRNPGTPPGSLMQTTPAVPDDLMVRSLIYDAGSAHEEIGNRCDPPAEWQGNLWLDIAGTPRAGDLERLRDRLGLHVLALEDVVTGGQRAKLDDYDNALLLVMSRPYWKDGEVQLEQISLFLGENFVVSIREQADDLFAPVRQRLLAHVGVLAKSGVDRLYHALLDMVVDQGFPTLDRLGELSEEIEAALLDRPDNDTLSRIYQLKRDLLQMRRQLWPMREAMNRLILPYSEHIGAELKPYLKDVYDHVLFQLDMVEAYRDMAASMLDVYLSSASHRLNEIMRVLTIISTIFMPLTFITGLYGMNFVVDSSSPWAMPLTHWRYGYPLVLTVMLTVAVSMLWFFKRKRWI